jgi:YidC/Oxa1 family membrane protein insertase
VQTGQGAGKTATPAVGSPGAAVATTQAVPKDVPRVKIDAPRIRGSISLLGARIDDLVLVDYRETLSPTSPFVRILEPRSDPKPYYAQYGWTAPAGETVKVPDNETVWTASAGSLTPDSPVTLSWDNGAGLTFQIELSVDKDYMFGVRQAVRNASGQPVHLFPWSRVRRDYKPEVLGYYILFEGLLGVIDGTLKETTYDSAKSDSEKTRGIAYEAAATGGWIGITDKYWLTALIPDQTVPSRVFFRYSGETGDHYQADTVTQEPQTAPPGGEASMTSHLFAGAKLVKLLDLYQDAFKIPSFDKAVDFGWFYFLTRPIFFAIDYLNNLLGNFGLAILVFTVFVKALFFPLANYSYRSMSKMKLLAPKMTEMRERYKDEPQRMQQEMMKMYREEKVNPASGCLPMVVQIPVFFALYKVLFVTIEMRQAPFYGWIHDLSQVDPTNVFNLFGLIPFDPSIYVPFLHLGAWPLIMGFTMWLQMQLNPPPPDPIQAKLFQFMPIVFTFMLAGFPAGLVIYWSWNNLLSIGQQWLIMRQTRLDKPNQPKG